MNDKKGFTLIELIVVVVIIGILAAIAIPRFMGAQNRARISAAEADVTKIRQACGLYEIDYATYPPDAATYVALVASLVDKSGNAYMSLPLENITFTFVSYTGSATTFLITVEAFDNTTTSVFGSPDRTWHE